MDARVWTALAMMVVVAVRTFNNWYHVTKSKPKFTVQAPQLNESLYELHRPEGVPKVQVLFFHGFQRDYENPHLTTWTAGDESGLWPQTWLVKKFPDAHILCVSYQGGMLKDIENRRNSEDVDMFIVVENLISDLLQENVGQEPRCPLVLVGHSFGGLIVKKLCLDVFNQMAVSKIDSPRAQKLKNFCENLKGLFFYATPHHGISGKSAPFVNPELLMPTGPLFDYVKVLSKQTARLNSKFDKLQNQQEWIIGGLGESSPTKWGRFEGLIVPEGSSRYCPDFNIVAGVDHISISRPKEIISRSFTALTGLLNSIADDPKYGPPENRQLLPLSIVGIEHVLDDVKHKLKTTPRLGFVGMGGVGKTTLAKALFNDIEKSYQYTCFISDVKNLKGSQDTKVKDAMLKHLYCGGKQRKAEDSGLNFLRGQRLLLVLDDVSSEGDLEIVRILSDVHKDSRFIATSRDRVPLDLSSYEVHGVNYLSPKSSRKLFLSYAFRNADGFRPDDTFNDLVDDILEKCGNLPLTLEVIGKHLHRKPKPIWKEALHTLLCKANQLAGIDEKLWAVLRLSYDGLESKEKHMFLDATTVFHKQELRIAMEAWSITIGGLQNTVWGRLVDLSLVGEVNEMGKVTIGMHEQLLDLGRMIASNPRENGNCRIWDSEMAFKLLSPDNEEMDDVKDIIVLKCYKSELESYSMNMRSAQGMTSTPDNCVSISGRKLQKMTKLQYLCLEGIDIDQTHGSILPSALVYLHLSRVDFSGFTFNPHNQYRIAILKIVGCTGLRKLPETVVRLQGLKHIELLNTSLPSSPDPGKLRSTTVSTGVPNYQYGLESKVQEVKEKLEYTNVLGIVGMGGLGKTTLAKQVFNSISKDFEYACFVENVKSIQFALAETVLSHFYKSGRKVERTRWKNLKEKQTLIVMDDVDSADQLRVLPELEYLGSGSRIIITTRNEEVLKFYRNVSLYDMDFLYWDEAEDLFCSHAFGRKGIPDYLTERSQEVRRVITFCDGLPLVLEVIGCCLRDKEDYPEIWVAIIRKLEKTRGLNGVLKVGFDLLDEEEQEMFLEAGTIFPGHTLDEALASWSTTISNPESKWANLLSKSMVKEVREERPLFSTGGPSIYRKMIWVHEHLRDLAKNLTYGNLASGSDKLLTVLNGSQIGEDTRALKLRRTSTPVQLDCLVKLKQLIYLEMSDVNVDGKGYLPPARGQKLKKIEFDEDGLGKEFASELKVLRWRNLLSESNRTLFPFTVDKMDNLAVLELSGLEIPEGPLEALGNLTSLRILTLMDLTGLHSLPENFGELCHLKHLTLSHLGLRRLPESFRNLSSLVTLDINNCRALASLPLSFGCNLTALKHLCIEGCPLLGRLPESFSQLSGLQIFYLSNCN